MALFGFLNGIVIIQDCKGSEVLVSSIHPHSKSCVKWHCSELEVNVISTLLPDFIWKCKVDPLQHVSKTTKINF